LAAGLLPIVCVGETGAERQAGQTQDVLRRQVRGAFDALTAPATTVVAYEPVWAIGTGVAATAQDANDAISFIRRELAGVLGATPPSRGRRWCGPRGARRAPGRGRWARGGGGSGGRAHLPRDGPKGRPRRPKGPEGRPPAAFGGPTATGKSALGLAIAERFDG